MAKLDDLQFERGHWQEVSSRSRERVWANDRGDTLSLILCHGPPGVPVRGAAAAFGEQLRITLAPAEGEILSVEERQAAGTRVILAFASRREGSGRTYTASIFVPFARFSYVFLVECPEYGITGVREAVQACAQSLGSGPQGSELDAELDRLLPDHPHHRCRGYLKEIAESLHASPALLAADPWPPWRLRSSGITVDDQKLMIRQSSGVIRDMPFSQIRRCEVRRSWKPGAIPFVVAGLFGVILSWFWLVGLWAGLGAFTGLLLVVGGLVSLYPWQLELETNDGRRLNRELIGTTNWERDGLRDYLTNLLSETNKDRELPGSAAGFLF